MQKIFQVHGSCSKLIAFVHIEKTGGTTVKFILRNSLGLRHCDVVTQNPNGVFSDQELRFAKRVFFNLQSISGHSLRHPTAHLSGDIQFFTFLRDPVERVVSKYQEARQTRWWRRKRYRREGYKKPSFDEFIHKKNNSNVQTKRIAGVVDLDKAKEEIDNNYFFVGLTERFQESIKALQKLCPYKIDTRYEPLRVARDNTIKREVLNNSAAYDLLVEANAVDIELYDYVREVVYPSQLRKANLVTVDVDDEKEQQDFYPYRYRVNRFYNNSVYKQLVKLRKVLLR